MVVNIRIKKMSYLFFIAVIFLSLTGCATGTSVITQLVTPPSVCDTVDSLESAIIAIRLSNTALLHTPMTENCRWPVDLSKAPSQETLLKMGVSGVVMSQGENVSFERDPKTGLPRPTSPLYMMLKDKETILKRAKLRGQNIHRNALMAFGAVSLNKKEVEELELELIANEKGFKKCQGLISADSKTFKKGIKEKYCPNKAMLVVKFDTHRDALAQDRGDAKKKFAPLAKNVSRVILANLDYLGAALTQMTGTIVKMPSAINNAKNEFKRLRPHDVDMMVSRLENIKQIAPYFPQHMSDQISIYKTLYGVLKDEYSDEFDDEKKTAQQVLGRVLAVETAYNGMRGKIDALARGEDINFSADEEKTWDRLAALFLPEEQRLDQNEPYPQIMIALNFAVQEILLKKERVQP
jgi:hypothetical protein